MVSVSSNYDSIKAQGTLGFLSSNPPPQLLGNFVFFAAKKQTSFCSLLQHYEVIMFTQGNSQKYLPQLPKKRKSQS